MGRRWRDVGGLRGIGIGIGIVACAALGLVSCDAVEPLACTDQFVYGLAVEVVDATNGVGLAASATLTLRDGDFLQTSTESFDGLTLLGAGERAGTYEVTVSHPGYADWMRSSIEVTADECHVIPVTLRAELVALP